VADREVDMKLVPGIVLSLLLFSMTWAHDLVPPAWRGQKATTYQDWRFDHSDNPAEPEAGWNPYGDALAYVTVGYFGSGWWDQLPGFGTQSGYWDIGGAGGSIILDVETAASAGYQEVYVQVTCYTDLTQPPTVGVTVPSAQKLSEQSFVVEHIDIGGDWILLQSVWRVDPNPAYSEVSVIADVAAGSIVDQVVIDTRSLPPPNCNDPFADADGDGDVDQADFARWQLCQSGSGGGLQSGCECFDRDNGGAGDGDVDGDDLLAFEACASGPGLPANPACDG
jgi:hypothetical protein